MRTGLRSTPGGCLRMLLSGAIVNAPLAAYAQGWIVGGSVGTTTQNDYEVGGPIATRDDSDAAFRAFGGYQISPAQAVVASYVDLGKAEYDGSAFGGFSDSLEADGFDISYVVGWAPGTQSRVSLFGTVGIFAWDQNVSYTDSFGLFQANDEGASFSFGLGTEIDLGADGAGPWRLHLDYQIFKDVGDEDNSGHELDREFISLGVAYRFGNPD